MAETGGGLTDSNQLPAGLRDLADRFAERETASMLLSLVSLDFPELT